MTNLRLTVAMLFTLAVLMLAQGANAQTPPTVILTPNNATGEVTFKLNTATNDARLTETCIYRIDANSPNVDVPVACAPPSAGRVPTVEEASPNGEGVVLEIPVVVEILPFDQRFVARNVADVGGTPIESANSPNTGVLPLAVVAPFFIVRGSN